MNFAYSLEEEHVISQLAIFTLGIEFRDEFRSTKRDVFNSL